jgi:hypothetical protein
MVSRRERTEEYVKKLLAPALVMLPLLGGVPTEAVLAAPNYALGIREGDAPIVKVEERCGNGFFLDEYGRCLRWYGGEPAHNPHEGCPPDRHFVRWINHQGGFCQRNY